MLPVWGDSARPALRLLSREKEWVVEVLLCPRFLSNAGPKLINQRALIAYLLLLLPLPIIMQTSFQFNASLFMCSRTKWIGCMKDKIRKHIKHYEIDQKEGVSHTNDPSSLS